MGKAEVSLAKILSETARILPRLAFSVLLLGLLAPLAIALHDLLPREAARAMVGVYLVIGFLTAFLLCNLTRQALRGELLRWRQAAGSDRMGAMVGTSVLSHLLTFLGLLALVVPGLLLATRWCVAVPVSLFEQRSGWQALQRSSELTAGHRWPLFGLVAALFTLPLSFGLAETFLVRPLGLPLLDLAVNSIAQILRLTALVVMVVAYHQLLPTTGEAETPSVGLTPER